MTPAVKIKTGPSLPGRPYLGVCFEKGLIVLIITIAAMFNFMSCKTTGTSALAPPPPGDVESFSAYEEGVPGGIIGKTIEINARVTAIDHFNREVTLLGSDGKQRTVKVGPEAVNFDNIQAGDLVKVTVAEQLVVYIDDTNNSVEGSVAVVALGAQAGGLAAEAREIVATVSKIDREKRTATLQFQDGSTKTFPVRNDIDLTKHKVGEQVVFHITEMVAVSIEQP